uniref:MSA micropeptide, isoform A n=1 Tax=Drosophila melanogaster TaxID=7227 RepID=A0ACD4DB37_DROME|nr:MSA micropeptide, isoform A [Drosophila melanogaster]UYI58781.1 MSA micropeptide, isoform A [Drosophila melanogaster]
MLNLEFMSN